MANYTENFSSTSGDTVDDTELEGEFDAIATAIATKLDADGGNAMTGALDMGSNLISNVAAAVSTNDAVNFSLLAIRQIQIATLTSDDDNTTTTYADSGLTDSITLSYSASKVVIIVSAPVSATYVSGGAVANRFGTYQVYRSSGTPAEIMSSNVGRTADSGTDAKASYGSCVMIATETPGAGTHTYKLRHKSGASGVRSRVAGSSNTQAVMVLLEVKP